MSESPSEKTVGHFTVKEKPGNRVEITCNKCHIGMETGPKFGSIPGDELVKAFATQHAHKKGR